MAVLDDLMEQLGRGGLRIVDLTETLRPEYPVIQLPEQFNQAWNFKAEELSRYDERGPMWYWNNISFNEHTGTHFDAPVHWISGKDLPNNTVDTMPMQDMMAPVSVVDCSAEVAADMGFILTREHLERWEADHGRIPPRSWVFMRSDWRRIADPENYTNMHEDGAHSPGPDPECVRWMIEQRDVLGFGTECIGTDAGQAFEFDPPYPCHYLMHGHGRYGLQCMTNLDLLPATGAVVISTPLKIQDGSGSPLRVVALVAE